GLTRGEMSPLCSNFGIHVEERRLHKELISPTRQRDDPIDVLFVVGGVDHISDLLSTRCAQRVLLEHAEGNGLVGANDDFTVVRCTSPHRSLRVTEPWADGKPQQLESFAPNINAQLFLECEGQARRAMIEHDAFDLSHRRANLSPVNSATVMTKCHESSPRRSNV